MIGYNKSEIVGKMRERVILQNRIITQSDSGFQSEIYNDIGIYWSKIEYKTGFEEEDADKITNQQKINITLRYNILVNVNSRFVYRNELYQVEKVEYSDDRRFMTCVCVWRSSYTSIYAGSIFCSASLLAQSSLSAALMSVIKYQASLNAFGSVSADIALVQKVASSLNAFGTLTGDINFVQNMQASLLTSASVTGDISIPKLVQASLTGTGTTAADLTVNAPSASLLLDLYPNAAAAYSLRKLRSAYTGSAIRVRASTSGAEGDVSFDVNSTISASSTVTVTAVGTSGLSIGQQVTFSTFWNAGGSNQNVFVTTWYDQSGNGRNATQTTQANQPQVVSSGVVVLENGKPNLFFNGSTSFLLTASSVISTNFSVYSVAKTPNSGTSRTGFVLSQYAVNDANRTYFAITRPTDLTIGVQIGTQIDFILTNQNFVQQLYYWNRNSGSIEFAANNASVTTAFNSTIAQNSGLGFGGFQAGARSLINIQEVVIYTTSQSSNRTDISTNINTHYGIY